MLLVGKMTKKKKGKKKRRKKKNRRRNPSGSAMWVCTDLVGQSGWGNSSQSFKH